MEIGPREIWKMLVLKVGVMQSQTKDAGSHQELEFSPRPQREEAMITA